MSKNIKRLRHRSQSLEQLKARRILIGLQKGPVINTSKPSSKYFVWIKQRRLWQRIVIYIFVFIILFAAQAYAIAFWYQQRHKNETLIYGVTFIADYARYLGLDANETFLALRDDLGFQRFRLVSYWEDIETSPGVYDFSELDWQFDRVGEVGGKVTLAIGLRQPRWPECHIPTWLEDQPETVWYPQLKNIMRATIERYRNRPELQSYQLENEYFLSVFGECKKFGSPRSRLIDEFNFVKNLDPDHKLILSLANNYWGIPTGQPRADQFGISVYKRVYDYTVTHRYLEYPFPSWYYSWRSGLTEIFTGRSSMLHELQAEPWPPMDIRDASIAEQNKSMNANRLSERIGYGRNTGFREIDLWGGEWWYWRKVHFNDPSLWNVVKKEIPKPGI